MKPASAGGAHVAREELRGFAPGLSPVIQAADNKKALPALRNEPGGVDDESVHGVTEVVEGEQGVLEVLPLMRG